MQLNFWFRLFYFYNFKAAKSSAIIMVPNEQLELAFKFVGETNKNIFLTGKAGTGKTTFLQQLKKESPKRMAVVAPTGVAAINAGGVTIHSFFNLPFGPYIPDNSNGLKRSFNKDKINLIRSLDLLVIDEISMVRADTLDNIDEILRRYKNPSKPFGGLQLLMIGDLHQLSPIIKDDEWQLLKSYYENIYFFSSNALQKSAPVTIELKHIYRQTDADFIDLLNCVRENKIDKRVLDKLNERFVPGFVPSDEDGYITLTTHNNSASEINFKKLSELPAEKKIFKAEVNGDFDEKIFPTLAELELKINAQVMFAKNDPSKDRLFYNGKIGIVTRFKDDLIYVKCDDREIAVSQLEWNNIKYSLNPETKLVEETIAGSFVQYPLKLAWAITIHKSQGLTFEKAIIDINQAFAFGQVYVALSRCKSWEGMILKSALQAGNIKNNTVIANYNDNAENNPASHDILENSKIEYQQSLIMGLIDFSKLRNNLLGILKIVKENQASFPPTLINNLHEILANVEKNILKVSAGFKNQLQNIFSPGAVPDGDEILQERVKKGAQYFLKQLNEVLVNNYGLFELEIDNQTVKKIFMEGLRRLKKETFVKSHILQKCGAGFDSITFLQTIANAEIDFDAENENYVVVSNENKFKSKPNGKLYGLLVDYRNKMAGEDNVPVYLVLSQKSISELSIRLPANLLELQTINGIGKVKAEKYGKEILAIVNNYVEENKVDRAAIEIIVEEPKENTKDISFQHFKEGKSINEIAAIRGLVSETIFGHLANFIASGKIKITDLMPEEKLGIIAEYLKKHPDQPNKITKEALGDDFAYNEIRAVANYLTTLKEV